MKSAFTLHHLGGSLQIYLEYLRISIQNMMAFRARYYIGVVTYVVHIAVYYFIYKSLFASRTGDIQGFDLNAMLTYVSIGWVSKSFYLNYIDRDLATEVRTGHIAMDLIKPIDLQLMNYARGIGQSLFRVILFTPPVLLATVLLFKVQAPASGLHLGAFILSTGLSAAVYLGINFLIGLTAIYFLSIEQILYSKNLMIELFSGLLIPINWFPHWFQTLSSLLPFESIAYVPLSIYLGRIAKPDLPAALAVQLFWAAILFLAGRLLWLACQRKMLIQGG